METVADILIIEDDPSINEVVCAHLERRGYRCRQAFSGTEGLMLLREQRPDVVITDLMLPGVPGEEIVRAIRGADSALPSSSSRRASPPPTRFPFCKPAPTTT